VKDLAWLAPDGQEMNDEAWNADFVRSIGMLLSGHAIEEVDEKGEEVIGDTLLVLFNAHDQQVPFALPPLEPDQRWQRIIDTIDVHPPERAFKGRSTYPLEGRSVAVFKLTPPLKDRRRKADPADVAAHAPADAPDPPETVGVEG
jgi:glycogen operon protein